jgi:hypothetical protein
MGGELGNFFKNHRGPPFGFLRRQARKFFIEILEASQKILRNFFVCKMLVFKLKMLRKLRFFILKNIKFGTFLLKNGKFGTNCMKSLSKVKKPARKFFEKCMCFKLKILKK